LPDVATPHLFQNGAAIPIAYRNIDNIAPAGSINSSVLDMARWLRFVLAKGTFNGQQLIRPATLREIESPQTIVPAPDDTLMPSTHFRAYGLGIGMSDYLGVKVLSHTGGIDGMLSQVTFVPERNFGVVILTNTEGHNNLFAALARRVLDAYLGAPPRDWSAIMLAQVRADEVRQKAAADRALAGRPKDTHPSVPLERYAGHYTNEMYGDVNVANENGHLVLRFGTAFVGDLEHWAFDSYVINWHDKRTDRGFVTFTVDARGHVSAVAMAASMPPAPPRLQDMDEFKRTVDETVQR